MRILLIALTALATTTIAMPIAAQAQDTVVIKKDNGHHYGWRHNRGHHYGWRNHHRDRKVVVIKERDRHVHRRHHHRETTGASINLRVGN